jgi:hypothetical protein
MSAFPPGSILNLQGWSNTLHPGIPHRLRRMDPVPYRQLQRSHARYRRWARDARPQYPAVDVYRCGERDGGAYGWCDAESDAVRSSFSSSCQYHLRCNAHAKRIPVEDTSRWRCQPRRGRLLARWKRGAGLTGSGTWLCLRRRR